MAVPNQTPYTVYTANGVTTVFPFNFMVFSATDLAVSINGTVLNSGFTVSGVGIVNGGAVTFLTPPASGVTVMLARVMPLVRVTEYQDNGDLLAATVNKDFDRIWMVLQGQAVDNSLALSRPGIAYDYYAGRGYRITNIADPINDQDGTTKKYVSNVVSAAVAVEANARIAGDAAEEAARVADVASLQAQITGGATVPASAFSIVSFHEQIIPNSLTIPDNRNAWSYGPTVTIADNAVVTVGVNSFWTIA
ncbi:phage tail fiber protein [Yersinia enterocolitica]|uniref:phage tail fiber domain-containing protein n=1 Tax=Yersinia enterocolitica TaxID=630 RepID=UPI003D00C705